MDDFEPPTPPKGENTDSKNLMNKTEDTSDNKPIKKRKGLFKALFKKSKKDKKESEDSNLPEAQKTNFNSSNEDDALKNSATIEDLDKDTESNDSEDFEEDLLSETNKDVKVEGDGTLLDEVDAIEPEPSMKEDDLDNIRAALGVDKSSRKSIREEFEDNPESFENENEDLKSSLEETNLDDEKADDVTEDFDKDIMESFDEETKQTKVKEEDIPPAEEKIKLFEDEIDLESFDEGVHEGDGVLGSEEKVVGADDLKFEEDHADEEVDLGSFDEEQKVVEPELNIEEIKPDVKNELPVFDEEDEDEGKYFKEFDKKIKNKFIKFNNLTEKKIEKLIKDAAAKKKSALLDKDREKILLVNFEQEVKKTISNNIDSIKKEELKVVEQINKKSESLDKKDDALNKKTETFEKKKEKLEQEIQKTEDKLKSLQKDLVSKEEDLNKLENKYDEKKGKLSLLDDKKKEINTEIKELKSSLSEIKKNHKKESEEYTKKLDEIKTKTQNAEDKLKKTKEKVENELKRISEKEQDIVKKEENLKKLIEEEKNVLKLLKKANVTEDKTSNVYQEEFSSGDVLGYDSFIERIDDCKALIENKKLDVAKRKYNSLRNDFMAGEFSSKEKNVLKEKLKDLFNSISKS